MMQKRVTSNLETIRLLDSLTYIHLMHFVGVFNLMELFSNFVQKTIIDCIIKHMICSQTPQTLITKTSLINNVKDMFIFKLNSLIYVCNYIQEKVNLFSFNSKYGLIFSRILYCSLNLYIQV